jgi:hypothetical protein
LSLFVLSQGVTGVALDGSWFLTPLPWTPKKKLGCEQYSTLILCTHVCEELAGLEAAMNQAMNRNIDAFQIVYIATCTG